MTPRSSGVRALAAALALAALCATPAGAALFDDDEARKRIEATNQRLGQIQQQLEDRIAALETQLKNLGLVEIFNQVELLKADTARLRGQLEVLAHEQEEGRKRQRDLYIDLDTRLRRIEAGPPQAVAPAAPAAPTPAAPTPAAPFAAAGTVAPAAGAPGALPAPAPGPMPAPAAPLAAPALALAPAPGAAVPAAPTGLPPAAGTRPAPAAAPAAAAAGARPAAPAPAPVDSTAAEQRSYDAALDLFRSGSYGGAVGAFGTFIKTYPKSPLAPSAQYWIGNAHFAQRDFRAAIAAQRQLVAAYPDSQKVPDALLNIGTSQYELGEAPAARRTLEDLVKRYPQSDAAAKARQRLSGR